MLKYVDGGSVGRPHVAKALVEKAKEISPEEAIQFIHEAVGVAIVAHPVYYGRDKKIQKLIIASELDGVEVYHRDHSHNDILHYEECVEKWEQTVGKPLLRTGGSDFHHETYGRKMEPLGKTTIDVSLAQNVLNTITS